MARISEGTFRNWMDKDKVDATDYRREQEIIRQAINDTQDQVDALANMNDDALGLEEAGLLFAPLAAVNDLSQRTEEAITLAGQTVTRDALVAEVDNKVPLVVDEKLAPVNEQLVNTANKFTNVFHKKTTGTYDKASVLSAIANDDNNAPQVLGFSNSQKTSTYADRDSVAIYASNRSIEPTVTVQTGTFEYGATSVKVTGTTIANLDKIEEGMLIDTFHTPNRYSSLVSSVDILNQTIYVKDGWYMMQTGGSATPSIPPNTAGFDVNRVTKLWGINNNVFLDEGKQTMHAVAEEIGLFKTKTTAGASIGGVDLVNFKKKAAFGFKARKASNPDAEGFDVGLVIDDSDYGIVVHTESATQYLIASSFNDDSSVQGFNITALGELSKLKLKASVIGNGKLSFSSQNERIFIINKTVQENFNLPSPSGKGGEMLFVINYSPTVHVVLTSTGGNIVTNSASASSRTLLSKSSAIFVSDGTNWYALSGHFVGSTPSHIRTGSGVPAVTPDFVGQQYLDTTNKKTYTAYGVASSADWA